ncbi:hypothetical protein M2451_002770 [Dysgonomonas sp. PFB1-18]|uniref:hypothetical protein n=1 Tax=unclassified Dysgonomonas TaxID=2630389 RepID=UPI0024730B1F|nr:MULTISPECIES: hypothetical protein [unclassified Dysgonomonas]MDH6309344.1 hypothetical protein [Dysgonomonas sp. PF1-14]MDH6339791.1 hypothetical protein [Dysgonomonas sp. PF1-16]MDH6381439.1 hypothetical protein [Dysgonomonas sp. PFB1-18]MDH6398654.1 hypothetical protein [Dysgonomonas sp. PF1-23]
MKSYIVYLIICTLLSVFYSCRDERNPEEERTKWIGFYNDNKADYARFVDFLTKNEDRFEKTNSMTILYSNRGEHDTITDALKLQLQEFDDLKLFHRIYYFDNYIEFTVNFQCFSHIDKEYKDLYIYSYNGLLPASYANYPHKEKIDKYWWYVVYQGAFF